MTADSDNKLIMASQMCNSKLTAADIDAQLSVSQYESAKVLQADKTLQSVADRSGNTLIKLSKRGYEVC